MKKIITPSIALCFQHNSLTNQIYIWHQIRNDDTYVGHYELPGGGIEKGETPLEAVEREWLEEVGFPLKGFKLWMIHLHETPNANIVLHVHVRKIDKGEISQFEKASGMWLDLNDLILEKYLGKMMPANLSIYQKFSQLDPVTI